MARPWNEFAFTVAMPHLAPGGKLSEVEFLKVLNAFQWEAIARVLGRPSQGLANAQGERLYSSFIDVELHLGEYHSFDRFGEGARVSVRNRVELYAQRFAEGLFVLSDEEVPDDLLETIKTRDELRSLTLPWVSMTNAFIAPLGENNRLKVFKPAGIEGIDLPELAEPPAGIESQRRVQATGRIEPLGEWPGAVDLRPRRRERIRYQILPESDLNGAGLVYFARFVAMMNYGERIFLSEHLERPLSSQLNACLSTDHRRLYFFANANPTESVEIDVSARLLPPGSGSAGDAARPYRTPFRLEFRTDLYRGGDKVLMASTLVRKSLNVPGHEKGVLAEASRLLASLA